MLKWHQCLFVTAIWFGHSLKSSFLGRKQIQVLDFGYSQVENHLQDMCQVLFVKLIYWLLTEVVVRMRLHTVPSLGGVTYSLHRCMYTVSSKLPAFKRESFLLMLAEKAAQCCRSPSGDFVLFQHILHPFTRNKQKRSCSLIKSVSNIKITWEYHF